MGEGHHIGRPARRPDGAEKATGRARYVSDLVRPGMLHGKIKFSAHAHARIRRIDTTRAERLPGVHAVITGENTPEIRIGFLRDNVALKRGVVRQFRDEIAAVAATDPRVAAEAVELIEVEYESLPSVHTVEEALAKGAPLVHETDARGRRLASNVVPLDYRHESGDLEAGRRAARWVAEGVFSTPRIQQCCLGAAGCIAEMDAAGDLTMWAKTQIPFLAQRDYRQALEAMGLPGRTARVIVPTLGGAFGTGLDTHAYEYIAILLAHRTGRPVRIVYDREEEFAFLSPRQSAQVRVAQGCDGSGRLTFREVEVTQDNGAYTSWGATYPTVMMVPATSLYRVANVRFSARLVYTHNTYCQAMRGYGNPEVTFAIESNLDDLARQAGIDPFELRRVNCNQPGEVTPMGLRVTTCGLAQCLDAVARGLNWSAADRGRERGNGGTEERGHGRSSHAPPLPPPSRSKGVGMAALVHVGGGARIYRSDGGGVALRLDDFGTVRVSCGGVEMGQGLHTALTLAVADAVGVRPEQVAINPTDTATCPWDVGTHASRGAFIACHAALRAAALVRERLFALAPALFPAEIEKSLAAYRREHPGYRAPDFDVAAAAARPGAFDLRDGALFLRDAPAESWLRLDLARFLRAAHFRGRQGEMIAAEAFYEPPTDLPDWKEGRGNLSACYAYGAQGVEVEVDRETGEVAILRAVAAHDVGKVLEPQALAGQIHGALAQGVGYALYEEVRSRQGRIENPSFRDYKIPTAREMGFPVEMRFIETDDPAGPFGAKGVGEPGLVPTAPAIANAILDAVGVRIRDLPITPEKVLAALAELESSKNP
ncbi:MAG: xanthine dehydrogenase family protein molybdopterin-binding subunit [Planctomycetes bacterium]|nr:xanthine dehydrogenase family protein molybdopterin-binding subunit [Planctomycetota bacterium]